eukprot:TRINITY_DN8696_c0_g1_i3.p1 TRINITY_DN8696_c0_g1~~TRINITY_DN8696_c0_g1_i3.p1  ORF type:complete len:699 (+),score=141.33 TRINITY_DN8696_c0_g1_i3:151-2247(+)
MDTTVDPAPTASRHFRSSKRTAGQPSNSASSSPSTKRSHGGGSRATVSEGEPTSAVKTGLNFDAMAAKHGLAPTSSKCPVCLEQFEDPVVVPCGHSACHKCMELQIKLVTPANCPTCRRVFQPDDIQPNLALAKAFSTTTSTTNTPRPRSSSSRTSVKPPLIPHTSSAPVGLAQAPPAVDLNQVLEQALGDRAGSDAHLDYRGLNSLISKLVQQRDAMQTDLQVLDLQLCEDFLRRAHEERLHQMARLQREMDILSQDTQTIQKRISNLRDTYEEAEPGRVPSSATTGGPGPLLNVLASSSPASMPAREQDPVALREQPVSSQMSKHELHVRRKARIYRHFDDLERAYFEAHTSYGRDVSGALNKFQSDLTRFTKYCGFELAGKVKYGNLYNTSSIISSIEFDRDEALFATAGVTKKIRIYEYRSVLSGQDDDQPHLPTMTMNCRTYISCLSWNPFFRDHIASADYEGVVQIWNAATGDKIMAFEEHEKRTWSVDTSPSDPTSLASGSDDHCVKLWSTRARNHSTGTITTKANVCCVKFDPEDSRYLAFGSADHHVHYYDRRNLSTSVATFKGHSKAVSYVRFLSSHELVSASTDSSLKLWDLNTNSCARTFEGHRNDKNFVGLTHHGDYLACGSEDNAVYVYYKTLEKPIVMHTCNEASEGARPEQKSFVSCVAWRKSSDVLLAANSLGLIHVLRLK